MTDFIADLKRRYIYRVAAAYAVAAWLLLQLFNNVAPLLKVPDWIGTTLLVLLIGGLPIALTFAWMMDLNAASALKRAALEPAGTAGLPRSGLRTAEQGVDHRQVASVNTPVTPLIDGPSLVVLPFANLSDDPGQDFFADGLTEDIITDLSRFRHLFIISRNSAFRYKGRAVDVREVARELGVRYVVEGSVRKAGNRVRVTVQLIDGHLDHHIWAERYDRELEDIFALQDEVTAAIVATLTGRVEHATGQQVGRKPTENMTAYECVLAGKLLHHRSTAEDNKKAQEMLDRAIALDPNYAQAHAWKACTLGQSFVNGYASDANATMAQAMQELQIALGLNSNDSDVHRILAAVYLSGSQHDKALHHQQRALCLNPNDDLVVVQQGEILTWIGQAEEGIAWIEKAMRLNPFHPERFWNHLGRAYFVARRYREAASAFARIAAPECSHHAFLASCYAQIGDKDAAQRHVAEVLKRAPEFSAASFLLTLHYKRPEDIEHHRAALLNAGLPE